MSIRKDLSPSTAARIAGISLLFMAAIAIFANFVVLEGLVQPDDAVATAASIADNESLFRLGVAAFPVIAVLDVVVALALYVVFAQVNRSVSMLAGWFRLAYTAVFVAGMHYLLGALKLAADADHLAAVPEAQVADLIQLSIGSFQDNWLMAIVLFGVHLGVLGYLAYRSGYVPKILGVLLVLASASYLADAFLQILLPEYGDTVALIITVPAFIGEIALALWLVVRANRIPNEVPA